MSSAWDEVTVIRKKVGSSTIKSESSLNAARRSGMAIATEKKIAGQTHVDDHQKKAKIDRETEDFHHEKLGLSVARAIQKARQEKGWTQKDLGVKINEKNTVINDYESGKVIPNQQVK